MTGQKLDTIIALLQQLVDLQKSRPAPRVAQSGQAPGGHVLLDVEIQYPPTSYGGGKGYFYTGCATLNGIPTRISFGVPMSKFATKLNVGDVVHCQARRDSQDDKYGNPKYWFSSLVRIETASGEKPPAPAPATPATPQGQSSTLIDNQDVPF